MKTMAILGAASPVGAAIAARFGDQGWSVLELEDIRSEDAAPRVARIDFSDEDAWSSVAGAVAGHERVALVLCPSAVDSGGLLDADDETWRRVHVGDQLGPVLAVKHLMPHIARGDDGRVIAVRSVLGTTALAGAPLFHASAGAIGQLIRNVAVNFAAQGVRSSSVLVSPFTPAFAALDDALASLTGLGRPPQAAAVDVSEVVDVVEFLVSPRSSGINGAEIAVDGGYLAQ